MSDIMVLNFMQNVVLCLRVFDQIRHPEVVTGVTASRTSRLRPPTLGRSFSQRDSSTSQQMKQEDSSKASPVRLTPGQRWRHASHCCRCPPVPLNALKHLMDEERRKPANGERREEPATSG